MYKYSKSAPHSRGFFYSYGRAHFYIEFTACPALYEVMKTDVSLPDPATFSIPQFAEPVIRLKSAVNHALAVMGEKAHAGAYRCFVDSRAGDGELVRAFMGAAGDRLHYFAFEGRKVEQEKARMVGEEHPDLVYSLSLYASAVKGWRNLSRWIETSVHDDIAAQTGQKPFIVLNADMSANGRTIIDTLASDGNLSKIGLLITTFRASTMRPSDLRDIQRKADPVNVPVMALHYAAL